MFRRPENPCKPSGIQKKKVISIHFWSGAVRVERHRCPLQPQTLVEGEASPAAKLYTRALQATLLLLVMQAVFLLTDTSTTALGFMLPFLVPAALLLVGSLMLPSETILLTTQGVESQTGWMDYSELHDISVFWTSVTLTGRNGAKLRLNYMREPHALAELIWQLKARYGL